LRDPPLHLIMTDNDHGAWYAVQQSACLHTLAWRLLKTVMQPYGVVTVDKLNLREKPGTAGRILGVLTRGTVLHILKEAGSGWLQVRADETDAQGFVNGTYLTLSDSKPTVAAAGPKSLPADGSRCEVKTPNLNVRAGPGTDYGVVTTVTQGAVLNVLDGQGDWIKVRVGMDEGYVAAQYVDLTTTKPSTGFLIEQLDLLSVNLPAARIIPPQPANASAAVVARTWNNYGGLIGKLAAMLSVPVSSVVAVLAAESGGNCFGPDGRLIIRFENHIFYNYWGQQHPETFNRFFAFDTSAPANAWKGHLWRRDENSPWQSFHGNQDLEWQVLIIARALDDTAALSSISMGAPQIMGFNFRRIGYNSVQRMFSEFAHSAHVQLLALFDFVKGMNANAPAIQALQNRDYLAFAKMYNGTANAQTYADIIQRCVGLFNRLIQTAAPPQPGTTNPDTPA
jgi:uncharacterized protein YraI